MKRNQYQVAIVGGGLGGLTLAIQLADKGYSCIVFEKNTYPFHRVCGEYISMESWRFLEKLGMNLSDQQLPQIHQLKVSSPSGHTLTCKLDLGGFGISRYSLDDQLQQLAKRKGVCVLDGCKVQDVNFQKEVFMIQSNKGEYTADIAIGAWGKQSNMDTALERKFTASLNKKEKNYIGIKYHVKLNFPSDQIELHNFKNGYCGISKIEGDAYCMCYLTAAKNLKQFNGNIKKMEEEVLMQNPVLKRYFSSATFLFDEPIAISQIRIGYKRAVENQLLLIGDAAGNIAPLSGNGMSMAMRTSHHLYGLLNDYFEKKISRIELNALHEKFWKKQFKRRIQISSVLQALLKSERLTNITISVLNKIPALKKAVIRSTHGNEF
jgi:menaquinone-9 beta-reductase